MAILLRGANILLLLLLVCAGIAFGFDYLFGYPCAKAKEDYLRMPVQHENRSVFAEQLARCRGSAAERAEALKILRATTGRNW